MAVKPSVIDSASGKAIRKTKKESIAALSIADYSYELPASRIAQEPLPKRDDAKLLVYDGRINGQASDAAISDSSTSTFDPNIYDSRFSHLAAHIPANSFLVVNNIRVIHARLFFLSQTGAHIEILLLNPISPSEIALAMNARGSCVWAAYVGNARRWRDEELISVVHSTIGSSVGNVKIVVKKVGTATETQHVSISWTTENIAFGAVGNGAVSELTFGGLLELAGHVPLPPYMKRDDVIADKERYQTVYAKPQGSVAAPTAGLHFTPQVMAALIAKGVSIEHVTLHVGAGTFKPVTADTISTHVMHAEQIVVSRSFLHELKSAVEHRRTIVCVGTTSVRTIESFYWIGVKLLAGRANIDIKQWDAYDLLQTVPISGSISGPISSADALAAVIAHLDSNQLDAISCSTQLLIAPGYTFRFVDMLITNFHVPKSTLLLLVAAFIGDDWKRVYAHALANRYRFLSYGDSSLLIPRKE